MLEYVFFQDEPRQQFLTFLAGQGVAWGLEARGSEIVVVIDDSALDDELLGRLELLYDDLFDLERSLYEQRRGRAEGRRGVVLSLKDGRAVTAELPGELVDRILTVLSPEELGCLADAIAQAVESAGPEARPAKGVS